MSGNSSIDEVIKEIKLIEQQIIDIDKQIEELSHIGLLGQKVIHKQYGVGDITEQKENIIKVEFQDIGTKSFNVLVVFMKDSLKFNDSSITNVIKNVNDLNNIKVKLEKDKKVIQNELDNQIHIQLEDKNKIQQESKKLVNRICTEILKNLKNPYAFNAKPTIYSCIQISKNNWLNVDTKGLHYEVWCSNIGTADLFGSSNARVVIGFHIEGRNPKIDSIVKKLEQYDIYRKDRGYIVEKIIKDLNFYSEEEIQKSIKVIVENVNKLDDKYTKIIDEVIEDV